jgi:hypothetical protein
MAYTRIISVSKCSHDANASIRTNARKLRKNETAAERKLSFPPLGETGKGVR